MFFPRLLKLIDGWNIQYFKIYPADSVTFFKEIVMNVIKYKVNSSEVSQIFFQKIFYFQKSFRKDPTLFSCFSTHAIIIKTITKKFRMMIIWRTLKNILIKFLAVLKREVIKTEKKNKEQIIFFQDYPISKFAA